MNYKITIKTPDSATNIVDGSFSNTILSSALKAGVNLPYSCNAGTCGACRCRLTQGKIQQKSNLPDTLDNDLILACQAVPKSDITVEVLKIDVRVYLTKVIAIKKLNDIIILKLQILSNSLFNPTPGQFVEIHHKGIVRCYSIANLPNEDGYVEFYIRYYKSGVFSKVLSEQLHVGQTLRIKGPYGNFMFNDNDKVPHLLMVCTGTGFAPIKSILQSLISTYSSRVYNYKRKVHLIWGNSESDFYYWRSILADLECTVSSIELITTLCSKTASSNIGYYTGDVVAYMSSTYTNLQSYEVYACGNQNMLLEVEALAKKLKACKFYSDTFLAAN